MSESRVHVVARLVRSLTVEELLELRRILNEGEGGDPTGVGAIIPPDIPPKEGAAARPLPEDYWETAE